MIKEDFIQRSPVRVFEKNLHGGLKQGEIGVVTAKKGVGKTSMLVQLGLDGLFQDKFVVHISFSQHVDHALTWYNDMFDEIAKKKNLDKTAELKAQIIAARVVLNFNQDTVHTKQIIKTIKALCSGEKKPAAIMIDDFDFIKVEPEEMAELKNFAREMGVVIWCTAKAEVKTATIDPSLAKHIDQIDVLLYLAPSPEFIDIQVLKEHEHKNFDSGIRFDTKTMLLSEK